MESTATIRARTSRLCIYLVVLTLFCTMLVVSNRSASSGASAVVLTRSSNGGSATDTFTGDPSGSRQDQQIRLLLEQSGYEGGGTAVHFVDPITGYLVGSIDDQPLRALLIRSGYEGGGTVVRASPRANGPPCFPMVSGECS